MSCRRSRGLTSTPALASALHKAPSSKLIVISTAGSGVDSPLGALRQRALGLRTVKRRGALTEALSEDLRMLEWAVPADGALTISEVKKSNPASWLTTKALKEQRGRLADVDFRRFVANQWVADITSWLPPGSWQDVAGAPSFTNGERIWVGVDVGGTEADTAVCWVNENLDVGVRIFSGDEGVLHAKELIEHLAETYTIVEVAFDPWRAKQLALELQDRRIRCVEFPQTSARMHPASERLYRAIIEKRLTHPDDPALNRHVAAAVAKSSPRGWQLAKAPGGGNVDGAIALAMAVDRASEPPPEPPKFLGFL
jgi:phage terminase large subunit-like protein